MSNESEFYNLDTSANPLNYKTKRVLLNPSQSPPLNIENGENISANSNKRPIKRIIIEDYDEQDLQTIVSGNFFLAN